MRNIQQTLKNWEKNRELYGVPNKLSQIYYIYDMETCGKYNSKNLTINQLLELEGQGRILIFT